MLIYWRPKARHKSVKKNQKLSQLNPQLNHKNRNNNNSVTNASYAHRTLYVWFTLKKYDVEQMDAIQRIAKLLSVSPGDITFAGIKDKRALTYQRGSVAIHPSRAVPLAQSPIHNARVTAEDGGEVETDGPYPSAKKPRVEPPPESASMGGYGSVLIPPLTSVVEPRSAYNEAIDSAVRQLLSLSMQHCSPAEGRTQLPLEIGDISYCDRPIRMGELWGNQFRIVLRAVTCDISSLSPLEVIRERLQRTTKECGLGFPNYFGSQRMGIARMDSMHTSKSSDPTNDADDNPKAFDMPVGPYIGKCLLTGAYQDAIERIILGDGCCQTVAALMIHTNKINSSKLRLIKDFPLHCTCLLCDARQSYLKGEPLKTILSKVSL